MKQNFESQLSGGHPNSLGNTVIVVENILSKPAYFQEFFDCYYSKDDVVRLRVSNGMKRICKVNPDLVYSKISELITKISKINQASTQWTLAQLFLMLETKLTKSERLKAIEIMQKNLTTSKDWIVIAQTMQTLAKWAERDELLSMWLKPQLEILTQDTHKSVASKANKFLDIL